jgi:type II secretory pathway component PulF
MMGSIAYRYRALRQDGTMEEGVLERDGRDEAVGALRFRGLLPVSVDRSEDRPAIRRRVSAGDLAVGLRTLAVLLDSGLSVSRALSAFEDTAPPGWRQAMPALRNRIREGDSLGSALEVSGVGVPTLTIGIIKAGEGGSGLAPAVRRAAELAESSAALRASIRAALAYPTLLAIVGTASIAIVVGVVLPRFATIIAGVGGSVPMLARGVIAAGEFARAAALPAVIMALGSAVLWRVWSRDPEWCRRMHRALLASPIVGPLRLAAASSRLCSALAALLDAGVPMATALAHSAGAVGDNEVERRVLDAREEVISGARLSTALGRQAGTTPTATRLIHAGEESGQLGQMLGRAAALDVTRLEDGLRALVRIIEPVLIIAFAAVIALVCGALLQTVYAVKP